MMDGNGFPHKEQQHLHHRAMHKVYDALEYLDPQPRSPIVHGGRSIWGGILFLSYLPLLILYCVNSIVPLYGPLPSCCACASDITPPTSFVYLGQTDDCNNNATCRVWVQDQLSRVCNAAVNYLDPVEPDVRVDIDLIICSGVISGNPCTPKCQDLSNKWLGQQDYTFPMNKEQAWERCASQVGLCDFKAVFAEADISKFPMSICRYPELTGIFTRLGAGLGLVNGLLVTVRMLIRSLWVRVEEKEEEDGKIRDYFKGIFLGIVFNYLTIMYMLVSTDVPKRMRYGAQLAIGLLIGFFKPPLVLFLIKLLGQFWAPMMVFFFISAFNYLILLRTLYCILRLETRSRELSEQLMHEDSASYDYDSRLNARFITLLPHSVWRNFFVGFFGNVFTFIYMLKLSWHRRNSGYFAGAVCGTTVLTVGIVWTLMYSYHLWRTILFDFPFPLTYSYATVYWQSTYFTFTTAASMTFVYYLCYFLKALPDQHGKFLSGTKKQYRMAFVMTIVPVLLMFIIFFFVFFYPYTNQPLPDSEADCSFPIYQVFIPFLGVFPGLVVFIFTKVSRVRWGAFAACGFSFLALSIVLNIFIFQYCLGNAPSRRPFYPLVSASEVLGSFMVVYGSIRPNRVRRTAKKEEHNQKSLPNL